VSCQCSNQIHGKPDNCRNSNRRFSKTPYRQNLWGFYCIILIVLSNALTVNSNKSPCIWHTPSSSSWDKQS
jgi:hypothetical protein